ncbi:MAG: NAD(P)/FAD-dependent oxidoreductase [Chthoniobacteraceae bacterium]
MHEEQCDVAIVGGAFSGAATAMLIKRRHPAARVVIIEKADAFDRKVGESTTEVSSCFLTRVLGITQHLGHEQLAKQGLRFWFTPSVDEAFDRCVEMGARYNSRLPGFQVDRATLDEHVLKLACDAGCELWRPAKVGAVDVEARRVEVGDRVLCAKWIVDATGRAALLARQLGHFRANTDHPINSLWARFRGVKDWDGCDLRERFPAWAGATRTARSWATNHLMGYGWWCWIIPLKGGDTSVGLVYDSRLFQPPAGATIGGRLQAHFSTHPVGREILSSAEPIEGDQRAFSSLAYWSEKIADDGWVCVGDAASFLDPLYSSGLDFCAFTASGAAALICRSLDGEDVRGAAEEFNTRFQFCHRAWFEGIYRDKYYYVGDAELWAAAFLLDIVSYHLGPVRQVYADPARRFEQFPFEGVPGRVARCVLSFYNRRLVRLAQRRMAAGVYGRRNAGWRLLVGGFLPDASALRLLLRGVCWWLRAEWCDLFLRVPVPPVRDRPAR